MNIFIPLLLGLIIGYLLRIKDKEVNVDKPMSAALLLLIFFMGVEAGKVKISAGWLLISSVVFATLTIAGSLGFAVLLGGRR
ncbi:hypothetical protein [Thermococcus sp.]